MTPLLEVTRLRGTNLTSFVRPQKLNTIRQEVNYFIKLPTKMEEQIKRASLQEIMNM